MSCETYGAPRGLLVRAQPPRVELAQHDVAFALEQRDELARLLRRALHRVGDDRAAARGVRAAAPHVRIPPHGFREAVERADVADTDDLREERSLDLALVREMILPRLERPAQPPRARGNREPDDAEARAALTAGLLNHLDSEPANLALDEPAPAARRPDRGHREVLHADLRVLAGREASAAVARGEHHLEEVADDGRVELLRDERDSAAVGLRLGRRRKRRARLARDDRDRGDRVVVAPARLFILSSE